MKILWHPESEPYSVEFTCQKCGARLQAEADDVRLGRFGVRDDLETSYYVSCPVCGGEHFLDTAAVPAYVRQQAKERSR